MIIALDVFTSSTLTKKNCYYIHVNTNNNTDFIKDIYKGNNYNINFIGNGYNFCNTKNDDKF